MKCPKCHKSMLPQESHPIMNEYEIKEKIIQKERYVCLNCSYKTKWENIK